MRERRQQDWGLRLTVGIALLVMGMYLTWQGALSGLDRMVYDNFIRKLEVPVSKRILVVGIDSPSLARLGRWPFPRSYHAELLKKIMQGEPAVIGMDINFREPDTTVPDNDRELINAVRDSGRVVFPVTLEQDASGRLIEGLPMPALHRVAAALGHVDTEMDADGITRSAFLMAGLERPRWPSLSLAMTQVAGEWSSGKHFPESENAPVYSRAEPGVWRRHKRVLIPFPAPGDNLAGVSYVDVMRGKLPPEVFEDKYVLVGATATGLGDNIPMPISAQDRPVAGVEYNAYVLNALLQDRLIVPVSRAWQYLFNALLVVLLVLLYRPRGWGWVFAVALSLMAVLGLDFILLWQFGYWYPPSVMLLNIVLFFLVLNGHQLRKLLQVLFHERQLSHTALTAIDEAVVHLDRLGRISKLNPRAEKLAAMDTDTARGRWVDEVFEMKFSKNGQRFSLQKHQQHEQPLHDNLLSLKNSRNEEYQVRLSLKQVPGLERDNQALVMVLSDVSAEHALANAVAYRETHNVLTDLPNRDLIVEALQNALQRAAGAGGQVAVVYLDIDHFAQINEVKGVDVGNQLLQAVASKLRQFLGQRAQIGHIGGDEFLLILEARDLNQPLEEMVSGLFALFARPLTVADDSMRISVTLGVSISPLHGDTPELLVSRASTAMHLGKQEGGGQVYYYAPGMQDRANRNLHIESLLHAALEEDRFEIFYQPLVDTSSLKIVGVEALSRLRDHDGQYIDPGEFIAVAERTGLIVEMGYRQLYRAGRQIREWREQGFSMRLSYNFSPRQIKTPALMERLEKILQEIGLDPRWLDFEITENLLLSDEKRVKLVLQQLQVLGVEVTIDDFGTGYSSMSYLTRYQFDRLKIDRSFIENLDGDPGAEAITSAIISMAHDLGMKVVAEGVETRTQFELLRSQACDEIQGFFLGRPMSANDMGDFFVTHGGNAPFPGAANLPGG